MKLFVDLDLKRFAAQEHRIVFVLTFRCAKQFYVPNMQEQSKAGKNQKSTDKHSSFDGLIQEDIDLCDIYLAVYLIHVEVVRIYYQFGDRFYRKAKSLLYDIMNNS